jgi:hypothetical protein
MALTDAILKGTKTYFDKFIQVTLYKPTDDEKNAALSLVGANLTVVSDFTDDTKGASEKIIITCPPAGLKPSMSLSLTMLPYGYTTSIKLSIENFTPEVDINEYTYMAVRAGYRSKTYTDPAAGTVVFGCAIISSIIEQPNPNGRTTFTGLVGNWFQDALTQVWRRVIINAPTVKLGDLIAGVCAGTTMSGTVDKSLGGGLGIIYDISQVPSLILNSEVSIGVADSRPFVKQMTTAYEVLNWLIDTIKSWNMSVVQKAWLAAETDVAKARAADEQQLIYFFNDNKLTVCLKGNVANLDKEQVEYINLARISSVTFQGSALMVTAPWVPELMPGGLFHLDTKYIRGRPAPNIVMSALTDQSGLYRVLQMQVDFDTNGSQNTMQIQAIAQSLYGGEDIMTLQDAYNGVEEPEYTGLVVSSKQPAGFDIVFGAKPTIESVPEVTRKEKQEWDTITSEYQEGKLPSNDLFKVGDPDVNDGLETMWAITRAKILSGVEWPSDSQSGGAGDFWPWGRGIDLIETRPHLLYVILLHTFIYYEKLIRDEPIYNLSGVGVKYSAVLTKKVAAARILALWKNPHAINQGDILAIPNLSSFTQLKTYEPLYRQLYVNREEINRLHVGINSPINLDVLKGWWAYMWSIEHGGIGKINDFWNALDAGELPPE